ncbi:unnamed protein product [Pseudo-nitzschia multistriata]|uniref:Uncharacterized protein n=1 Tax=Pseudo-nitzschia multistriata TaxID=183589 RepID=A0A448ZKU4_9STRA|nr:unnamed protein product [Pseudo-nitzschia multistriata]
MKAGWLDPFVIDKSGNFIIEASHSCDQIFRLNLSDEGTEYLLIENRQPIGFDFFLPQGGLAIWHIDEIASNVEGFPEQEGIPWPVNGKHYKVSLLQADGAYDLENRRNNGDEFDLFHKEGVDFLAPSVNFMEGPYPSTDSYQKIPARTGILIHQISHSAPSMSFSVNLMNELSSAFLGGNGASGTMFDILPVKDINIRKIYLNLAVDETVNVELWTRTGTHISFENKPWLWQRSVVVSVDGNGRGKKSCMDIENLPLNANTRYGFYLVLTKGRFRYTNGIAAGSVSVSNEDLTVYEGVGLTRPFGKVYQNRIWNGGIFYDVLSEDGERSGGRRLETTFDGGSGQDGVMFDVLPKHDLDMDGFDLHLIDSDTVCVHVYTKEGPFTGSENKRDDWILLAKMNVKGKGINVATKVLLDHSDVITLKKDKLQAFYIFIENGRGLRYTEGHGTGNPVRSDDNLTIFEGVGVASQFGSIFQSRVWNGALHYRIKKN